MGKQYLRSPLFDVKVPLPAAMFSSPELGPMATSWAEFFDRIAKSRIWRSSGPLAELPRTLKAADEGYRYEETDYGHIYRWTGTAWGYAPEDRRSGEVAFFIEDPGDGWQICDGSSVTRTNSDGTTGSVTVPDLIGSYIKGGATYDGSVIAAVPAEISGETANESSHTHTVPENVANANSGDYAEVSAGTGTFVQLVSHTHVVPEIETEPGGAHKHGVGTLENDDTGEPQHVELLPYFRL
jgi:hypothetical protein